MKADLRVSLHPQIITKIQVFSFADVTYVLKKHFPVSYGQGLHLL